MADQDGQDRQLDRILERAEHFNAGAPQVIRDLIAVVRSQRTHIRTLEAENRSLREADWVKPGERYYDDPHGR
jgi:hypothetical protein